MSTSQAVNDANAGRARAGLPLLLLSAVAFSTVGFFTHKTQVDLWALIFWRNAFGALALLIVVTATGRRSGKRAQHRFGWREWTIGASWSFATICYIAAFAYTSVANISIIYAVAPVITTVLAWFCLGERVSNVTVAAAVLALSGVTLTVGGSAQAGTSFGDGLAILMTLALSGVAVLVRRRTYPAMTMALASSASTSLIVLPLGWIAGARFAISGVDAAWLAAFGIVTMAVALPCYLKGAAEVPAGRAMLISALEMPLAPLWVWLAFGETITLVALTGGIILGAAIILDVCCASAPVEPSPWVMTPLIPQPSSEPSSIPPRSRAGRTGGNS